MALRNAIDDQRQRLDRHDSTLSSQGERLVEARTERERLSRELAVERERNDTQDGAIASGREERERLATRLRAVDEALERLSQGVRDQGEKVGEIAQLRARVAELMKAQLAGEQRLAAVEERLAELQEERRQDRQRLRRIERALGIDPGD